MPTIDQILQKEDRRQLREDRQAIASISAILAAAFSVTLSQVLAIANSARRGTALESQIRIENQLSQIADRIQLITPLNRGRIEAVLAERLRLAALEGEALGNAMLSELDEPTAPPIMEGLLAAGLLATHARKARERIEIAAQRFSVGVSAVLVGAIALGLTTRQTRKRLTESFERVQSHVGTVVATESMSMMNLSLTEVYERVGISLVQVRSQEDNSVCPLCVARNRLVYPMADISTPFHPNCRCYVVPFTDSMVKSGRIDRDAEKATRELWISRVNRPDYRVAPFEKANGRERPPNAVWIP